MISNPIILSEDEAEALMRALGVEKPGAWTRERLVELRAIQVGATNAFEVIDAIRMELRRRRDGED